MVLVSLAQWYLPAALAVAEKAVEVTEAVEAMEEEVDAAGTGT